MKYIKKYETYFEKERLFIKETYHSDKDQLNYTNSSTNFILYHRSNGIDGKDIKQAFNDGFKPGEGSYYGYGLYGTYDIESQLRDGMYKYGKYIIECKIENTGKFIILDGKIGLKDQLKKIFKKYSIFYTKNKDVIEECEQLIKDKLYSTASLKMSRLKGFIQNVDGILFYGGGHDGNVIVLYNLDLINLNRYAIEDPSKRFKTYNDIKWKPLKNIIGYKLNNILDKNQLNKKLIDTDLFTRKEIENNIIYIDISDDKFNKLPDNLKIKYIECSFKNNKNISDIQLNYYFKTHNTINGNLNLYKSKIKSLPNNLTINGYLNLSYTQITSLPDNLTANGNLDLSYSNITSLPINLTVRGYLDISYTNITSLPNNLKIGGNLYLSYSNITSLPDNLTVGGNLNLYNSDIISLPDNLTVKGNLSLTCSKITSLPNDLKIGGDLYLTNTDITTLPNNLTVGGNLRLSYTMIKSLPNNLTVGGDLRLSYTMIKSLPNNLTVGGDLYLSKSNITSLPNDLKVGGKIIR